MATQVLKAVFIFCAASVVFFLLSKNSLWLDENISISIAEQGPFAIWDYRTNDYNPPLFDLLLVPIFKLFGVSETTARSPSAIAYVFILVIVAFSRRGGFFNFLGLFLFAFSLPVVVFALEARPYLMVVAVALFIILGLCERAESSELWRKKDILIFSILFSVLNYLHYCGVIFSVGATVSMLLWRKRLSLRLKDWLGVTALQAILYLPWMKAILRHSQNIPEWLSTHFGSLISDLSKVSKFTFISPIVALGGLLVAAVALFWTYRTNRHKFSLLLMIHSFWVLPLAITLFILHFISQGRLVSRHIIEIIPGLVVASAMSLSVISKKSRTLGILLAGALVVLHIQHLVDKKPWNQNSVGMDEKGIAQSVLDARLPCADVITFWYKLTLDYYFQRAGVEQRVLFREPNDIEYFENTSCSDVFVVTIRRPDIFVVTNRHHAGDFETIYKDILNAKYKFISEKSFQGFILERWKRK